MISAATHISINLISRRTAAIFGLILNGLITDVNDKRQTVGLVVKAAFFRAVNQFDNFKVPTRSAEGPVFVCKGEYEIVIDPSDARRSRRCQRRASMDILRHRRRPLVGGSFLVNV